MQECDWRTELFIEVPQHTVAGSSKELSQVDSNGELRYVPEGPNAACMKSSEMGNVDELSQLAFRQIHVDFHTSEKVHDIASKLDSDEFAGVLKRAHVNAVTLFARCHHGWLYYDSGRFPERKHPHLQKDLLREQIASCANNEIDVSIYTSVQHDHYSAVKHPEWCCFDETGKIICFHKVFEPGFNRILCVNSPYRDFLKEHIKELCESFEVRGLFFDIVRPYVCSCRHCSDKMKALGIEPMEEKNREAFALRTISEFKLDMSEFIRSLNSGCRIFYNSGSISPHQADSFDAYTHFELESLPSTYGYLSFHALGSYARQRFSEVTGMTSRFHKNWGDFHSYRHPVAMEFECFRTLAEGMKCCVGDHLHPEGEMCSQSYRSIEKIYSRIETLEPYCVSATPLAEVGVVFPDHAPFPDGVVPESLLGVTDLLLRNKYQFDVIDSDQDFSAYTVLILPDEVRLDREKEDKIAAYMRNGGKVLASHNAGRREQSAEFLEALGVEFISEPEFSVEYVSLSDEWPGTAANDSQGHVLLERKQEYVMYEGGLVVRPAVNAKQLASTVSPYFERKYDSFFSHLHAPSSGRETGAAIVKGENAVYFAHPIFKIYREHGPFWCENMFYDALDSLLSSKIVEMQAPSHVICKVHTQDQQNRLVVHVLNYRSYKKGKDLEQVDEVVPLFDVNVSVKTTREVCSVAQTTDQAELPFEQKDGRVHFSLPRIDGYQVIVLSFTAEGNAEK